MPPRVAGLFEPSRFSKRQLFYAIALVSTIGIIPFILWPNLADSISASKCSEHLQCHLGKLGQVWIDVVAHSLIGFTYIAISATLACLVYRALHDIPFDWISLAVVPFMIGCGALGTGGGNVSVTVSPSSVTLSSNQKQQFTATISGTSNTGKTWSATAGSVDSNGLYTAPTVSSQSNAIVTATSNADFTKSAGAAVTVDPVDNPPLTITTGTLPQGQQGNTYNEVFTATGGTPPYSWTISAGTPPPGIAMNANGDFTGVPTAPGTFTFTVTVTDATQKTASGNFSVTVDDSTGSGGAPLTYSARTDNCVTGSESGCVSGTTTGQAGSALSFLLRTTDAVPFSEEAVMNSTATDPDFGAYLVMATDESTAAAEDSATPWTATWMMGSDGEWDAFSTDSSLLLVHNNNGNATLLYLNPSSIHAQTCTTIPCVVNSGVGSQASPDSSHLASGGDWNFSRVPSETNVLYEVENPPTAVDRVTICKSTGDPGCSSWSGSGPLLRTPYVDFTSDSPVNCNVLPTNYRAGAWASTFTVASDGTVAYGMGGGQDWTSGMTVTVNETFLFPSLYNAENKGFQATTVTGGPGVTEPDWESVCTTTCADGGVTWTNIGGVNSQGPGFDIVVYHPSGPAQGCTRINTRIGKIYRGTGNSAPAGYMTTNDDIACTRAANGGPVTKPCGLADEITLHDMNQSQNGQYILVAPTGSEGANSSGNWNWGTLSGQKSNAVWSGSVLGGSQTGGAYNSLGVYNAADAYATNAVVTLNGYYYTATASVPAGDAPPTPPTLSNSYWTQTEAYPATYIIDTTSTLVSPCTDYLDCNGHQAQGQLNMYYGGKYRSLLYSLPAINGLLNPDTAMLGATLPADDHGSYRNAGTQDLTPIFLVATDVPAWSTRYTAACYPEICAVSSDGLHTRYRFGHDYNTGSSTSFQAQNNIGVVSYLGDLVAFGTDMMGTRGSNVAANTPCNKLRGMFKPASMTLALGNTVFPLVGNNGNANGDIFQATIAGATGSSSPAGGWSQVEPVTITQVQATSTTATYTYTTTSGDSIVAGGTIIVSGLTNTQFDGSGSPAGTGMTVATATSSHFTITGSYTPISTTTDSGLGYTTQPWGGATVENIGWNTCRGDVVILDALSANAAP